MTESLGLKTKSAESGEDALFMLKKDHFDLVLMDWVMPGTNGIELSRKIRGKNPLNSDIPIIMMTAFGKEKKRREAQKAGVTRFLTKPISHAVLFNSIASIFGKEIINEDEISLPIALFRDYLKGTRILLAEDNPTNQEIMIAILESAGAIPVIASNGKAAVEAVMNNHFDMVLMDIQMPEMERI